jgi:hypothetical protein
VFSTPKIVWLGFGLLTVFRIPPKTGVAQQATDTPKLIEVVSDDDAPDGTRLAALLTALRGTPRARDLRWIAASTASGALNQTVAFFEYADLASAQRGQDIRHAVWQGLPAAIRPRLYARLWQFAPDQSFGNGLVPWSNAGALTILSVKTSMGGNDDYADQQQLAAQLLTKAHVTDEEWLGYRLRYGADYPAFMFVALFHSVAALDSAVFHGEVLPPVVDREREAALRQDVVGASWTLFVIRPELSSPSR